MPQSKQSKLKNSLVQGEKMKASLEVNQNWLNTFFYYFLRIPARSILQAANNRKD